MSLEFFHAMGGSVNAVNPKFEAALNKMRVMHNKKAADYSPSENRYKNFESAAISAGTTIDVVFRTLIGIKLARLAELQNNGKTPENESVMDSILDLANYSTLWLSYYQPDPTTLTTGSTTVPQLDPKILEEYRRASNGQPKITSDGITSPITLVNF